MDQGDKYIVYYSKNNYLPPFLFMDILLLFIAIIWIRSPYTTLGSGILILIVVIFIGIFVIVKMKNEKGEKLVLLEIDQNGILDCNPVLPKGFIAWKDVSEASIWKGSGSSVSLLLVLKEVNALKLDKKVFINLTYANIRPDQVLQMVNEYRFHA